MTKPIERVSRRDAAREAQARTLLALVVEHRDRCDREDCTLTMSLMLPLYEYVVCRDANPSEVRCFL